MVSTQFVPNGSFKEEDNAKRRKTEAARHNELVRDLTGVHLDPFSSSVDVSRSHTVCGLHVVETVLSICFAPVQEVRSFVDGTPRDYHIQRLLLNLIKIFPLFLIIGLVVGN